MENFLFENRFVLTSIAAAIFYCFAEWNNVKQYAYTAMLKAKDMAKDKVLGCGQEEEDWVVTALMTLLPKRITAFLGEAQIRYLVKFLYKKGMDYLDDGKINDSNNSSDESKDIVTDIEEGIDSIISGTNTISDEVKNTAETVVNDSPVEDAPKVEETVQTDAPISAPENQVSDTPVSTEEKNVQDNGVTENQ
jgi:hypothetical protein